MTWSGPAPAMPTSRPRHPAAMLFVLHFGLYSLTMMTLLAINLTTGTEHLWFLWPAWGWGIAVAAHGGSLWASHRMFGAQLLGSLTLVAGLFAIDRGSSVQTWAFWPALGLGLPALWYGLVSLRLINNFGAHLSTFVVGNAALLAIYLDRTRADRWYFWVLAAWAPLLLIHFLAHRHIIGKFGLHALLFLTIAGNLIAMDVVGRAGEMHWNVLLLPPWALALTAHGLIRFGLVTSKRDDESLPG